MDAFIVIPLMLTGYDCIDAINEQTPFNKLEALRATLILIVQGLYNQRHNHYLARVLYRVTRGRMRLQEVALLDNSMQLDMDEPNEKQAMVQPVRSSWPVSVVKKTDDIESYILTNLVANYAQDNIKC